MDDALRSLELEIKALKQQRKKERAEKKVQSTWVAVKRSFPSLDTQRVIAWSNEEMIPCWYSNEKFYSFDGTWFFTNKERVENVTHWMPKDWMYAQDWPLYGPGLKNWVRYQWLRFTEGASGMMRDFRPKGWGKNAQISKKVVYFKNDKTGEIRMGLPEHFPASQGFHKVVCNTAHEAEVWSDRLRQFNLSKENRLNEKREQIEGAQRDEIRKHMHHVMAHSRNNINREFVRRYLDKMDKIPSHTVREEYLHSEAYEERR